MDDNGTVIVDSHVISGYLVDKFGKNDKLYPKDLVKRAHVNSRLFYNASNIFSRIRSLFDPIFFEKCSKLDGWKVKYIENSWEIVDRFVAESPFVCGNDLTIADLSLISSISSIDEIVKIDPLMYPNLTEWFERMCRLPYYHEANGIGAKLFQKSLLKYLEMNKNF